MKKLCLAIAVGTAFAGAAQAQTKVETYGRLYPYFLSESNGSDKTNTLQTGNSNIGFRGNRDLGDGFKAGGQLEAGAYFDEGKDSSFAFDRNSFVYLETPYGEVRLGSFDTVFKDFGDELGILGISSGTPMSSSGVLIISVLLTAQSVRIQETIRNRKPVVFVAVVGAFSIQ
jgi:predicted porin